MFMIFYHVFTKYFYSIGIRIWKGKKVSFSNISLFENILFVAFGLQWVTLIITLQ